MSSVVLGLDIGGANLKAAWYSAGEGVAVRAVSRPFALWRQPDALAAQLTELTHAAPTAGLVAVTMTGELCDCFASKCEGVAAILDAVATAISPPVWFWTTEGRFVDLVRGRAQPLLLASANWLALATFAGRRWAARRAGLLVDVGSTTTDVIPFRDGTPVPRGRTDPERLRCGELVYTGVRRTPVCSLVRDNVAAELFATTQDVYLVLKSIPDAPLDRNTADGQAATCEAAHLRLARMLGADLQTSIAADRLGLARRAAAEQVRMLAAALARVTQTLAAAPEMVIISGEGEFLAERAITDDRNLRNAQVVSLWTACGREVSTAAGAFAVAVLAAEEAAGGRA